MFQTTNQQVKSSYTLSTGASAAPSNFNRSAVRPSTPQGTKALRSVEMCNVQMLQWM